MPTHWTQQEAAAFGGRHFSWMLLMVWDHDDLSHGGVTFMTTGRPCVGPEGCSPERLGNVGAWG